MPHRQNTTAGAVLERVGRLFPFMVTVTMGWSLSGVWLGWQGCLKSYQTKFSVTRLPGVCLLPPDCVFFLHWYRGFIYLMRYSVDVIYVVDICYVSLLLSTQEAVRVSKYLGMLDMFLSSQGWTIPIWRPKFWIWCPQGTCFRNNKSGRAAACYFHYGKCSYMTWHASPSNTTGSYQTQISPVSLHAHIPWKVRSIVPIWVIYFF